MGRPALVLVLLAGVLLAAARRQCMRNDFICNDRTCVPEYAKCDRIRDCAGGEDEADCGCQGDEFKCNSGQCIESRKRCDGYPHCDDRSDELDCSNVNKTWSGVHACQSRGQFMCGDGSCLSVVVRCNGQVECPKDSADEADCPCTPDQWQCDFGSCIARSKKCDGFIDCPTDRSDERDCFEECLETEFTCSDGSCIPLSEQCDGTVNCRDSSDENNCPPPDSKCDTKCDDGTCVDDKSECENCNRYQFRCGTGECISLTSKCDSITDCADGSDEYNCPVKQICARNEFPCNSGQCIQIHLRCDGSNDCYDGSDELDCSLCPAGKYECDDVCHDQSIVCDRKIDCSDGSDESNCPKCDLPKYACRDGSACLNFSQVCDRRRDCTDGSDEESCRSESDCENGQFQCESGECISMNLVCDNNYDCRDRSDETLSECSAYPTTQPPPVCRHDQFRCGSGECVSLSNRCDGVPNCRDNSDEQSPPCPRYITTYRPPIPTERPGGLMLRTYPNQQVIKQSPYPQGGEVVFQCRDEGNLRAPVKWIREGDRPMPYGTKDTNGRLEIPNIQLNDAGTYICQAVGYPPYAPGSQISVHLTVEEYKIDPSRPPVSCKINEATCSNGQCIPKSKVCDSIFDCSDKSDENGCKVHGRCEPNEFLCNNNRCILKSWVCDSEDDCKDGSDEVCTGVATPGNCLSNEFQCESNQCIPKSYHCDGERDCQDGSDEFGCSPVFISKPPIPMVHLQIGDTMTITCTAVGIPVPQVVWRLNWGHIPDKCSYTSVNGFGTLTCPNIQVRDQGAYSCEAINNKGSVFAVPDTIVTVSNNTFVDVCPAGYFNSEANVAQECISCFCFGATSQCRSADLFTYQIPPSLNSDSNLAGVIQVPGRPLEITDEPITDVFQLERQHSGAIITRVGPWSSSKIYPYLSLPETYSGSQLTSYGGYIKYTIIPQGDYSPPQEYESLPDIIIKGKGIIIFHSVTDKVIYRGRENEISVRIFEGPWKKVTSFGEQPASREDIMMVLAEIEMILLRAENDGAGVEIRNFQMDSARNVNSGQGLAAFVEKCSCPRGYSGLSCQSCSPGYQRVSSGRWLGQCVREEPSCGPGYYGNPAAGIACLPCPCPLTSGSNQFSRTCKLASDGKVTCDNCPPGHIGRRCEACASGYVGNPTIPGDYCRPAPPPPSRCDPRGTRNEHNGYCECKLYASGPRCSECVAQSFFLSNDNMHGCSACFCMGVTKSCSSSTWRRTLTTARFGSRSTASNVRLKLWSGGSDDEEDEESSDFSIQDLTIDPHKQEISYNRFDLAQPTTYYWSLPDRFIGNKVTAYGGYLNYTIRNIPAPGRENSESSAPDLQLLSKNHITLVHYSGTKPSSDGYLTGSVQFTEQYWKRTDGIQSDREHMLMALADLKEVLIKATYTTNSQEASLVSVSLEVADERGIGERASHVEHCQCPPGYLGTSCEDCAPGYFRTESGLYLGFCAPCECNGHSDQCHPDSGQCENCQHNTRGRSCEECEVGYVGNATLGSPNACVISSSENRECRCDPRGTQEAYCANGPTDCRCKANVEGEICSMCKPGTFDLSSSNPQGCSQCYCSGVTDSCYRATHLYRQQIPSAATDENHGFTLSTIDHQKIIDSNFQLNVPLNEVSYDNGPYPITDRLFWSLPKVFTGNKIASYGGNLAITQKFESRYNGETSSNDMDVVLVSPEKTIYWKNPSSIDAGVSTSYFVPLNESDWSSYSYGDSPRPVSRADFLYTLANLQEILVRATLSENTISTYIADVVMDTAVPVETSQEIVDDIEVCRCPEGYTGNSCESCSAGYYRNQDRYCIRCPCSNREESCQLGSGDRVICNCQPLYKGYDCSLEISDSEEFTTREPISQPTIQIIISRPTIQIKEVGSTAQFKCYASSQISSAPIRVTWSKEGGSLPYERTIEDANNGILTITSVRESDSGTYICQATDGYTIDSRTATLNVNEFPDSVRHAAGNQPIAPEISLTPTSLNIYEGDPIELLCSASGNPTPDITWSRTNRRPISRQHQSVNGRFIITSARLSDQGEYNCIASNIAGESYKSTIIYVQRRNDRRVPPTLSVNIPDPIIKAGSSLTLICSADQDIPLHLITWERENGYMPPNFRSSNGQLWIEEIRQEDGGRYICSAERVTENVIPITIEILVQAQTPQSPAIVQIDTTNVDSSGGLVLFEGQTYSVNCEPGGNPLPRIKWTKVGSEFEPGVTQRGNTLIISQAKWTDRGMYLCLGISSDGSTVAQSSIPVSVERRELPEVEVWPSGTQAVELGSDATLQCRVSKGIPEPALTWTRASGRPLSANAHLRDNGVLSLTRVTINDEGVYTCTGSNDVGQVSANSTIVIHSSPEITIRPSDRITVLQGASVTVECRAEGYPLPRVHWESVEPHNVLTPESPGVITLSFRQFEIINEGTYACIASNAAGTSEDRVFISVNDNEISFPTRGDTPGEDGGAGNDGDDIDQPVNPKIAREGETVDLVCNYKSPYETYYMWVRSDNQPLPYNSRQHDNVLYLRNITTQDSGFYECIVRSNSNGPVIQRHRLELIVKRPPRLVLQPPTQTVRPGDTATLDCVAYGDGPFSITWSPVRGNFPSRVEIRGSTLIFHNIEVTDAGQYVCRAENADSNAEATAEVIVNEDDKATHEASLNRHQTAEVNSRVVLFCSKTGGRVYEKITWTKNGYPVPEYAHLTNRGILIFDRVQLKDSGRYECIVESLGSFSTDYIDLVITGGSCNDNEFQCINSKICIPNMVLCDGYVDCDDNSDENCSRKEEYNGPLQSSVEVSPRKLSVREGESVTVTCRTTGEQFDLRWSKELSRERVNTVSISGGLVLKIDRVAARDAGTYRCTGRDRNGTPRYEDFSLTVLTETRRSVALSEIQSDAPEVHSAPLGSDIQMPCKTDLPAPVTFQWERPFAILPDNIVTKSPILQLLSVNESDAGPYICKVNNGYTSMERKLILKITHIVPNFSGSGYIALKTLSDAYVSFDIEIAVKPIGPNGIILYNSNRPGWDSGDFVSLTLVNGVPEFKFSLGSGVASISGDQALSMNEWHNIKIGRNEKDGFLYVDGSGPFTAESPGRSNGLDLEEPLYIGGVPDYNQLPDDIEPKQGFNGCIGRLVLENVDLFIMKDGIEKVNVNECDSCSPNPCQNNAVCQEALTERGHACLCPEGYSGLDCSQTGDACRPGLCAPGRCADTLEGYKCTCPIGYVGERCESRLEIEYPAFGGGSYLAYAPPKTAKHLKMGMKIKPGYPIKDGLILYCAESRHGHGDFTSLAVKDGYLEFRFSVGSNLTKIQSKKPLEANKWVTVIISRFLNKGKLSVEGQVAVSEKLSAGGQESLAKNRKSIYYKTPLYIGGYNEGWLTINKGTEIASGFSGCITDVELNGVKLDINSSPIETANVRECSEDYDGRRRGDIPPDATISPPEYESICSLCQNGGACPDPSTEYCKCPPGFDGQYCETQINPAETTDISTYSPCEVQPCQRNGTCRPLRGGLYRCDCPLGTGGYNCQNRVELGEDCSFSGEGYVELPARLLPHSSNSEEIIALAFTTSEPDGLLLLQGSNSENIKDGDFILLQVERDNVEFQWDLGEGVSTVRSKIIVTDNQRHSVVVKRTGGDVTLEVDREESFGKSPGITQLLNADSNLYIGGIPSHMTYSGLVGFTGCIHQIELMDLGAIHIGKNAVASRNANPCSNLESNDLMEEGKDFV